MCKLMSEIENFFDEDKDKKYREILSEAERLVKESSGPYYALRARIKDKNSVYAKLKKGRREKFYKNDGQIEPIYEQKSIQSIRDYAGMRVLCSFPEDVFEMNNLILELFSNIENEFSIKEIEIYNWIANNGDDLLKDIFVNSFGSRIIDNNKKVIIKFKTKESGYKSVHYIIEHIESELVVEIQLRTLFQDVWSVVEHELKYKKGQVSPVIMKDFMILAAEMNINDEKISHLRKQSNEQSIHEEMNHKRLSPRGYFIPEFNALEIVVDKCPDVDEHLEKYKRSIANSQTIEDCSVEWIDEARSKFTKVAETLEKCIEESNDEDFKTKAKFLIEMEKAYIKLAEGNLLIKNDYLELRKKHEDSYVLPFRLGEVYLIEGEIEEALKCFDDCENILDHDTNACNQLNHFRLKMYLAYVYWMLGDPYIDNAIIRVEDARKVWKNVHDGSIKDPKKSITRVDEFNSHDYGQLLNYLCWYRISKFLKLKQKTSGEDDITYQHEQNDLQLVGPSQKQASNLTWDEIAQHSLLLAKESYLSLEDYLEKEKKLHYDVAPNIIDTAAWFCFNYYKYGLDSYNEKLTFLKKAKCFSDDLGHWKKHTVHNLTMQIIHNAHITTITSEYEKVFGHSKK